MSVKKLFSILLAAAMLLTMLPVSTVAAADTVGDAEGPLYTGGTVTSDGIVLTKTAELQSDGTYTINLEAYATGTITTDMERKPTDIIIVMDVSGSMLDPDWTTEETPSWQLYEGWASTAMALQDSRGDQFYHKHGNSYHAVTLVKKENYTGYVYGYNGSGGYSRLYDSYGYYIYYENKDVYGYVCSQTSCKNAYGYVSNPSYYSDLALNIDGSAFQLGNLTNSALNGDRLIPASFELYRQTSDITRMDAMQAAVNEFITTTAAQNEGYAEDEQHRIALVKFAGHSFEGYLSGNHFYYDNNGSYGISSTYNADLYNTNCSQILYDMTCVNAGTTARLQNAVNSMIPAGPTMAHRGLYRARDVLTATQESAQAQDREQIILFFTDGEPTSKLNFDLNVANEAIDIAKNVKETYGAQVYTINMMPAESVTSNMTTFMQYVSSNYPSATSMSYTGTAGSSKYYKQVHDMADLNEVFDEISNTVCGTDITLDAESQLRDYMAEGFVITDTTKVVAKTVDYTGNGTWSSTPTVMQEYLANPAYAGSGITIDVDADHQTVFVEGFSYKDNYVLDASGSIPTQGKKLVVTITGVEATDAAATGTKVNTNTKESGIYEGGYSVALFPVPEARILRKSFVLDYAKPFSITPNDLGITDIVDLGISMAKCDGTQADADLTNGKITVSDGALNYTPQTISWDGYDSFYVLGSNAAGDTVTYQWVKVSVIPANNVYYEDDFVENAASGTVGIVYSGTWETVQGTAGENSTETPNGEVHGWENVLADDGDFSSGSSHISDANGANATFTFTGTGVDIYSYTDLDSGMIIATLTKDGETVSNMALMVDNLAASGEYYQIPTLSFSTVYDKELKQEVPMPYGTYTVKLIVSRAKAVNRDGNPVTDDAGNAAYRSTYHLDGIRVYNPVQNLEQEKDPVITDAYGEEELNAVFTEVRDLLIDAGSFGGTSAQDSEPAPVGEETSDAAAVTATLVTDVATLNPGDQIIIVATDYDYALSTNQKSNNRDQAAITKDGNTVSYGADTQIITLEKGNVDGTFAFQVGNGYLYAASSSNNYLRTQTTLTDNSSWSVTIDGSGIASIVAQGSNTRNTMRYNTTSSLFASYRPDNEQKDISIYKLIADGDDGDSGETGGDTPPISATGVVFIDQMEDKTTGQPTSDVGTYVDYGPKNEVYLAPGQSIVFRVAESSSHYYYVGLKAPEVDDPGTSDVNEGTVTVAYSASGGKQTIPISHSTDLYYKLNPDGDGYVVIQNVSGGLLSVTKLRTTGSSANGLQLLSMTGEEAVYQFLSFCARPDTGNAEGPEPAPEVPDTDDGEDAGSTEPAPEVPDTDDGEDAGSTEPAPEAPDVEIENPEPEQKPAANEWLRKLVESLFKSLLKWFIL